MLNLVKTLHIQLYSLTRVQHSKMQYMSQIYVEPPRGTMPHARHFQSPKVQASSESTHKCTRFSRSPRSPFHQNHGCSKPQSADLARELWSLQPCQGHLCQEVLIFFGLFDSVDHHAVEWSSPPFSPTPSLPRLQAYCSNTASP